MKTGSMRVSSLSSVYNFITETIAVFPDFDPHSSLVSGETSNILFPFLSK